MVLSKSKKKKTEKITSSRMCVLILSMDAYVEMHYDFIAHVQMYIYCFQIKPIVHSLFVWFLQFFPFIFLHFDFFSSFWLAVRAYVLHVLEK